jgi:hypothetical protein
VVTLARTYVKAMWENQTSLATWHPDLRISVGDIVAAGPGGLVVRETTLADIGYAQHALTVGTHPAGRVIDHHGVTIKAAAQGTAGGVAKARASFSSESSFLIVTRTGKQDRVDNLADARVVVKTLVEREVWKPTWHLVTSVRRYPACTVVIAKGGGVEAELEADSGVIANAPASIHAGASVSVDSDCASHWTMNFESTPLYEAIGVRRRGVLRRTEADLVEYLTRDGFQGGEAADAMEIEDTWVIQMSSPADLGLL